MSSNGTVDRFVAESKLFVHLDEPGRAAIVSIAEEVRFPPSTRILTEGEKGDCFFVLMSGQVRVSFERFGVEKHLATLGAGAVFGEIAALTDEPRSANVTTESEVHALRFVRGPVLEILNKYPKIVSLLHRVGLKRSEDTLQKILDDA